MTFFAGTECVVVRPLCTATAGAAAAAGGAGGGAGRGSLRVALMVTLAGSVLAGAALVGLAGPAAAATSPARSVAGSSRPTATAGSLPVGQAGYPIPAGALQVSPAGDDLAAGTATAPLRTLARAITLAPGGATIVLRAGTYHESVTAPAGKALTIQSAPGEAVWLDGSSPVTAFTPDAGRWRADGYTQRFDHSPTYTPGAPDNTTPGWSFTNSSYPMAAYPDQVFIDGIAQQQVKTLTQLTAGSFWVDTTSSALYLGSDPTGHQVRASDLTTAISLRGTDSTLRGIGVRRYATSVPLMGTVRALGARDTLTNIEVSDNATQGIFVGGANNASNITLDHISSLRNGLMGISANYADGLTAHAIRSTGNNDEHFNTSPAAGGFKATRSRGITLTDSVLATNNGNGFWTDESTYNLTATGNDLLNNAVHGLSFEISNRGIFADNIFAGNGQVGLKINDSGDSEVWNNTFTNNGLKPLWIVQDARQASNLSTLGHDPRQALPDPTETWTVNNINIHNNIFGPTTSNCLLCVEDAFLHRSATTMHITTDNNIYNRASTTRPTWLTVWASGATNPFVYTTLPAMRTATNQETHSTDLTGPTVLDPTYHPNTTITTLTPTTAAPLPATIATTTHQPTNTQHLGAFTN